MRTRASSGGTPNLVSLRRIDVELVGSKNGVNDTFGTPDKFHQVPETGAVIQVYWAGRRLVLDQDYTIAESGGVGSGYDTVTVLYPRKPLPKDRLSADYFVNS